MSPVGDERVAGFRYRPGLDGVRALAVVAVILYHGQTSWMPGGFLGVDLFFVLSGYLITSLLLVEREATGRIDLAAFWGRRGRRLLPALLLLLAGVAVYAAVWAQPTELHQIRSDGFAALFYVSNWKFVLDGRSYFEAFRAPSPLAHTWSLAIEEQWYLLWPAALLLLLRVFRGRTKLVAALVVGCALSSAVLMAALFHPGSDPSRVYYGTDTRAQALLLGAAFALLTAGRGAVLDLDRLRRPCVLQALGWAAIAGIVVLMLRVDSSVTLLYRGGFALAALGAVALIGAASVDGPLAAVLSIAPLRCIGVISYGLYLWHWPVDVVLDGARTGLGGVALLGARIAATFVLASLSYVLVERPIRSHGVGRLRWRPGVRPAILACAGAAAVSMLLVTTFGAVAEPSMSAFVAATRPAVPRTRPVADHTRARVLMLGDSQMFTMTYYDKLLATSGPQFAYASLIGCGVFDAVEHVGGECDSRASQWKAQVDSFNPDLSVLLIGVWESLDFRVHGHLYVHGTPGHEQALVAIITSALQTLTARGGRVALLEAPCLRASQHLDSKSIEVMNDPHSVANVNAALEEVARDEPGEVTFVPWADTICPGGRFIERVGGVDVRPDGVHYASTAGAEVATRRLVPAVRRLAAVAHAARGATPAPPAATP